MLRPAPSGAPSEAAAVGSANDLKRRLRRRIYHTFGSARKVDSDATDDAYIPTCMYGQSWPKIRRIIRNTPYNTGFGATVSYLYAAYYT